MWPVVLHQDGVGKRETVLNVPLRMWLRVRGPVVVGAALVLVAYAQRQWFAAALAVSTLGEALQVWSFASLRKNKELVARGPYTLVRNPMYIGRYFVILGFVLLAGNLWLIGAYTGMYALYMSFRVPQEEAVLAGIYHEAYRRYCQCVNRFLPRLRPFDGGAVWYFNRKLLAKNHGGWNALGVLAFYAAVAARLYFRAD